MLLYVGEAGAAAVLYQLCTYRSEVWRHHEEEMHQRQIE